MPGVLLANRKTQGHIYDKSQSSEYDSSNIFKALLSVVNHANYTSASQDLLPQCAFSRRASTSTCFTSDCLYSPRTLVSILGLPYNGDLGADIRERDAENNWIGFFAKEHGRVMFQFLCYFLLWPISLKPAFMARSYLPMNGITDCNCCRSNQKAAEALLILKRILTCLRIGSWHLLLKSSVAEPVQPCGRLFRNYGDGRRGTPCKMENEIMGLQNRMKGEEQQLEPRWISTRGHEDGQEELLWWM
nr:coatomer subunit beta'-2 isoform X1 [Ipomoea batatas]